MAKNKQMFSFINHIHIDYTILTFSLDLKLFPRYFDMHIEPFNADCLIITGELVNVVEVIVMPIIPYYTMVCRDHFAYVPSQWETVLQCNAVFHWLSAYTKWSLSMTSLIITNHMKINWHQVTRFKFHWFEITGKWDWILTHWGREKWSPFPRWHLRLDFL